MVVRCGARWVVRAGARAGAREPASCGLTAVSFALSRKCHARDYSAVGWGDERDLSELCATMGAGAGIEGGGVAGRFVRATSACGALRHSSD
ncbi:Flagellar hook-associated protein flgK [Burkholderia vietnamiensis]|nr:Flagellar hook-associated protein flgK [Burkholderia vietnamiensis]CAG9224483.1 Flagellar hook-associated protein flgK [Burkholderia vietnamiensis]